MKRLFPLLLVMIAMFLLHEAPASVLPFSGGMGAVVPCSEQFSQPDGFLLDTPASAVVFQTRKYKPRSTQPTTVGEEFQFHAGAPAILPPDDQIAHAVMETVRRTRLILPSPGWEYQHHTVERKDAVVCLPNVAV